VHFSRGKETAIPVFKKIFVPIIFPYLPAVS